MPPSVTSILQELPADLWAQLIYSRLQQKDCIRKGWVLEGFPRTREQALALQAKGTLAKHFVHLEAPDSVLIERYAGKRIDSLTGGTASCYCYLPLLLCGAVSHCLLHHRR